MLNTGDVANDNVKMTLALTLGMMINTRCATEAGCQTQVRVTLLAYILVVSYVTAGGGGEEPTKPNALPPKFVLTYQEKKG